MIGELSGKSVDQIIAQDHEKLSLMLTAATATTKEKKSQEGGKNNESKSEDDNMGFGLFD